MVEVYWLNGSLKPDFDVVKVVPKGIPLKHNEQTPDNRPSLFHGVPNWRGMVLTKSANKLCNSGFGYQVTQAFILR